MKNNKENNKLRINELSKLRNRGTHLHNLKVIREGMGDLIVAYRPKMSVSPENYVPCSCCYGWYAKTVIWKHKCPFKQPGSSLLKEGLALLPTPIGIDDSIKSLLASMRQDKVTLALKTDLVILEYIRQMFNKKGGYQNHRKGEIRGNAREVSRLLLELRRRPGQNSCSILDVIDPANYKNIISAIKNISGISFSSSNRATPELARKLGIHIKACALIVVGIAIERHDNQLREKAEDFIKLHNMKFSVEIGAEAKRIRNRATRNKPKLIPLSSDVVKMSNFLKKKAETCGEILEGDYLHHEKVSAYAELVKVTLTQLIVFNRRREGEVSRVKLEEFKNIKKSSERSDIENHLSKNEQALCQILTRMEIQGKGDRTVPVLLTPAIKSSLQLCLKWRNYVGVNRENEYLFASPSGSAKLHYRGSACLRQYSVESGVSHPKTLRSTKLRKHVASLSQILNLKENELDSLASFMGHDINIHRKFYRLPNDVIEVAKMSKLLLSLEQGGLKKQGGRTLDELQFSLEDGNKNFILTNSKVLI